MGKHLYNRLLALKAMAARWRRPLLLLALGAFAIGCYFSVRSSGIAAEDVEPLPFAALLCVFIPATIAYSSVNMMLMGRASGYPIGFATGVRVSAFAQVAEILPLPGGAMVRTLALMKAGLAPARSIELVLAFALLWIACGGIGAGIALARFGMPADAVVAASVVSVAAIAGWLAWRYDFATAMAAAGLRIAGMGLFCVRLALAFAAIGIPMAWIDAAPFAFVSILGTASGIFPAGLGITEALSALVALGSEVDPAKAFLAAALSRMTGFGVNMLLAAWFVLRDGRSRKQGNLALG